MTNEENISITFLGVFKVKVDLKNWGDYLVV